MCSDGTQSRTKINRGWNFGLDKMPSVHSAYCSAEECS